MPASIAVTSTDDTHWSGTVVMGRPLDANNQTTLRTAVEYANAIGGANTISISANAWITLRLGELSLTSDVTITGVQSVITTDPTNPNRVFEVAKFHNCSLGNLRIEHASVNGDGGGILNHGTLMVADCSVANNTATGNGGGIYNDAGATLTCSGSGISNNSAGGYGGGIYNVWVTTINGGGFMGNQATNGGGAIGDASTVGLGQPSLTVTNASIYGNSTTSPAHSGSGGGVFVSANGNVTIQDSSLQDNQADLGAGLAVFGADSVVELLNTGVIGNMAASGGGGAFLFKGQTTFDTRCQISNNTAPPGNGDGILWMASNGAALNNGALMVNNSVVKK